MELNYCELKKNTIYVEMYDELLDEELNMNNPEHNDKIKTYLQKKINDSDFVKVSGKFTDSNNMMEDLILKIESNAPNFKLQGNTLLMYADDSSMYELFYMEDLTQPIPPDSLNEFGSLTNIFLQPVCWTCGIFKSTYGKDGKIYSDIITKSDISKLYISNFYHIGVMMNQDGSMIELEFTGEDPYKMIGTNFNQSNTIDLFGFNLVPWIEKIKNLNDTQLNLNATKIFGSETYGRVFFAIVCPNTNKKFWDIKIKTMKDILLVINNKDIQDKISKEVEMAEININPFYIMKKNIL
jgi:hypothetical protein